MFVMFYPCIIHCSLDSSLETPHLWALNLVLAINPKFKKKKRGKQIIDVPIFFKLKGCKYNPNLSSLNIADYIMPASF